MKHIKKMKIDIDKKNFEIIPSVQYDSNTRFLHINLTNGSISFDLTGCSVKISGTKQDGTAIFNNCTIINAKKGFVEVELTEQINAIPGTVKCELKIYSESGVLTTKHFDIEVTAPLTASKEIVSSNEFKALTDALKVVQGIDNKADKEKVEEKFGEVYEQFDKNTKLINGIGVNINNYNNIKDINKRIETALKENIHVIIPEGNYNINGFEIPDGKIVECVGKVVLNTTNTILVGKGAMFIGENTQVLATSVNVNDFSIIKLSKACVVRLKRITGYKKSGESKGKSTVAKGIDATFSDFVNVQIGDITECKYAFYIEGGGSGTGLTINDSVFKARWIGDCYYGFYQAGDSQTHIYTEAYIEYCNVGYSLQDSFYGRHYVTFDNVELFFENRNKNWRSRLGEVYIPNFTATQLLNNVDRYFEATKFHMKDCSILTKSGNNPNIISATDSKIYMKSGNAAIRIISSDSAKYEGLVSQNDKSDCITNTIGNSSRFVVERATGDLLFSVDASGSGIKTRNGLTVGDSSVGYGHLKLSKGCLVFEEAIYNSANNAPNNSIFIDYSDDKLKFKDKDGVIKNITLS